MADNKEKHIFALVIHCKENKIFMRVASFTIFNIEYETVF